MSESISRTQISEWDATIRQGVGGSLVPKIQKIKMKDVPAPLRPEVAAIARRIGLYGTGLDLLKRDYLENRENIADKELLYAEYAALLTEIGATSLSAKIFSRIENPQLAKTYFYRALLSFKTRDSAGAAFDLNMFRQMESDAYWQKIADVNLINAHIFLREFEEVPRVLARMESLQPAGSQMAYAVSLEARGQLAFFNGKYEEALTLFTESFEGIKGSNNPSALYAEKWIVIVEMMTKPWPEVRLKFEEFRQRALKLGFWEIPREMDRFRAALENDNSALSRIFFGSPTKGYKEMLCRESKWIPPDEYFYFEEPTAKEMVGYIDAQSLEIFRDGKKVCKMPSLLLALVQSLLSDLYKPVTPMLLFELMYPDSYFEPENARQRVEQVLKRFRKLMKEKEIPITLISSNFGFSLKLGDGFAIRYAGQGLEETTPANRAAKNMKDALNARRMRSLFADRDFSAAEAAEAFDISRRSVNRFLSDLEKAGEISKTGMGRNIRYRLLKG